MEGSSPHPVPACPSLPPRGTQGYRYKHCHCSRERVYGLGRGEGGDGRGGEEKEQCYQGTVKGEGWGREVSAFMIGFLSFLVVYLDGVERATSSWCGGVALKVVPMAARWTFQVPWSPNSVEIVSSELNCRVGGGLFIAELQIIAHAGLSEHRHTKRETLVQQGETRPDQTHTHQPQKQGLLHRSKRTQAIPSVCLSPALNIILE